MTKISSFVSIEAIGQRPWAKEGKNLAWGTLVLTLGSAPSHFHVVLMMLFEISVVSWTS